MVKIKKTQSSKVPKTVNSSNRKRFYNFESDLINNEKPEWKRVFYFSFMCMVLITYLSGFNSSFHNDEMDMNAYGKANLKFYTSMGKDTSYRRPLVQGEDSVAPIIKTYGGLFDNIACSVNKLLGSSVKNEFNTRHALCQTMGLIIILVSGFLSLLLGAGFLGATLTAWLLFLTPTYFGLMIFDTKDIPFAFGYILSLYAIILYIKTLPAFKIKPIILLGTGIAFATGVRIGGVILIFFIAIYLLTYLYINKAVWKNMRNEKWRHFIAITGFIALGLFIAILNWPFALSSPFTNIPEALGVAAKFPQRIPIIFEGKSMYSLNIPWYYSIKWIAITVPVSILLMFIIGVFYVALNYRNNTAILYLFLVFALVFPIGTAIYAKMALYSQWRHLLFIYPLMVVVAARPFTDVMAKIKGKYSIPLAISICFALLAHPLYWSIKNHPFQYTYFNEISGGFAKNYDRYETDYWQVGIKKAVDWLYKNENPKNQNNVILATNAVPATKYLIRQLHNDNKTVVTYSGLKNLNTINWKYLLINVIFFESDDFNTKFPPYGTIHTIDVDGKPVCAIVKRTDRKDFEASEAKKRGDYKLADSLAISYLKEDPNAEGIYEVSVACRGIMNEWDKCFTICSEGLKRFPNNQKMLYYMALCYSSKNDLVNTAYYLELSVSNGNLPSRKIYRQLANIFHKLGDDVKAQYYYGLYQNTK